MTSVETKTILDGLVAERQKVLDKAAETLSEFVKSKAESGETEDLFRQMKTLLSEFTDAEANIILMLTVKKMAMITSNTKRAANGGSFKGAGKKQEKTKTSSVYGSFMGRGPYYH